MAKPALLLVVVAAVILTIMATKKWQERVLSRVTYPLILMQHRCAESFDWWRLEKMDKKELLEFLEKVVRERDALRCRVIELESFSCFDRESHELRTFAQRYRLSEAYTAQIIQKQLSREAHSFLVNAGERQGIKVDMVALYQHHLIGRVSEVYPSYAKVVLITDRASRVAAVATRTGARGIIEGSNDQELLRLNFVNHFDEIKPGDLVTSYGVGLVFPRGLAIGEVTHVEPAGVLKKVDVKPFVELRDLSFCLLASAEMIETAAAQEVDHTLIPKAAEPLAIPPSVPASETPSSLAGLAESESAASVSADAKTEPVGEAPPVDVVPPA